jgi:hypothetical protein
MGREPSYEGELLVLCNVAEEIAFASATVKCLRCGEKLR